MKNRWEKFSSKILFIRPIVTYILNIAAGFMMGLLGSDIFTNNSRDDWIWYNSRYALPSIICHVLSISFIIICSVLKKKRDNSSIIRHHFNDYIEHAFDKMKSNDSSLDANLENIKKLVNMDKKIRSETYRS